MLKGSGSPTKFEDIQPTINAVNDTMENMADVVAKHKKEIFDILGDNLAEEKNDEKLLKELRDSLNEKKDKFEETLGKSGSEIDLSKDDDLVDFWTNKVNGTFTGVSATISQKDEINLLIVETLEKVQNLDKQKPNRKLFGGATFDIKDIPKNTKLPEISNIINATDPSTIATNINNFVNNVSKTNNPFHIQHSKLYIKPDTQRQVAIRIALFVYQIDKIIKDDELTQDSYNKIKDILEKQIIPLETQKIKGIYNVKKELENVEPEYKVLEDINEGDRSEKNIDLGAEKFDNNIKSIEKGLSAEFENKSADKLDRYLLKGIKTTKSHHIEALNIHDSTASMDATIGEIEEADLHVTIGGKNVVLGRIGLDNKKAGDAEFIFKMTEWSKISSVLSDAEIKTNFPLEITFGVQGIKNVGNPANGKVGLTRDLVIKLEPGDSGGPTPAPTIGGLDEEIDVNFSDMKQTMSDIADERTYTEDSKEYMEELNKKKSPFGRMYVGAKWALLGNLFRHNKYKRIHDDINESKKGLDLEGHLADVAHVHSNQGLDVALKLTESEYPDVYNKISDLSYSYYKGDTTAIGESEFIKELKDIFNSATNLKNDLKSKGVDIDKSASDILDTLKLEKAQHKLSYDVQQSVATLLTKSKGPTDSDLDALAKDMVDKFNSFTKNNHIVPKLLLQYNKLTHNPKDKLNLTDSYEINAKKMTAHIVALQKIASESVTYQARLNIRFYAKGHATDHIEDKKKEVNPIFGFGNRVHGDGRQYGRSAIRAVTTAGTAILGTALAGPLGGVAIGSLTAGLFAAGKKAAQLKRKKHSIEKEYVKDRNNSVNFSNEEDLQKMEYLKTIGNYEQIKKEFDKLLSKPGFNDTDKDALVVLLSRIIAGLDHQKKTGHNAFSIDKKNSSEGEAERNYDKAMSQLYKYRDLTFKRLQLEDEKISEDNVRSKDIYKTYIDGYSNGYNDFLKKFKRQRQIDSLKTGATTAAIYAAAGLTTAAISHFMSGSTPDVSNVVSQVDTINTGDIVNNYDLGSFDASGAFTNDLHSQLSKIPDGMTNIHVDYFAGVDGTATNPASFTMNTVNNQVNEIQNILSTGHFSQETITNVNDVISQNNINSLLKEASTQGADQGNQYLFATRNLEGIEELLKQVDGKDSLKIDFNFNQSESVIGQTPHVPSDRLSGLDITAESDVIDIPEQVVEENTESIFGGQGLYTEDNTHKGQKD